MKWANYTPSHRGVRELGLDGGMKKAVGHGAGRLLAVLRESDPRGDYRVQGAGAYVGRRREARHAAVVRGSWFPGATTAAMKRAIAELAKQQRDGGR